MRKLLVYKRNDIGAIGIGAMIVLIAMILVAGVAASVLISTSNTLQSQAMKTGSQTIREVSSGLRVTSVLAYVYDNSANNITYDNITCLAITVETKAGSGTVDLNNTYILLSDGDTKVLISYNYSDTEFFTGSLRGDLFNTSSVNWANLTSDTFAIGVLIDADNSASRFSPVLNRGDKAVLYVLTNNSAVFGQRIGTRVEIFGQVIPEIGAPGVISFTSPKAYVQRIYTLQ